PPVAASVGVLTFGPPQSRYGVEHIAVRSACATASLPSIVRRMTLGSVPTSVWWTDDLSEVTPLEPLVVMGRQLLYDSRRWRDVRRGVRRLAALLGGSHSLDLADLNWRRLAPMRQGILHAAAASGGDITPPRSVHIRHRP